MYEEVFMKATEANLLKFMQKPKQMIVPIYQRKYSWTKTQCEKLWQDIERVADNPETQSHFIGSIVYIDDDSGSNIADITKYLLIDGQQRLTTTTILLFALGEAFKEEEEENTQRKINNYYIFNNEEEGESRFKLLPTKTDKRTLLAILNETELPNDASTRVLENYNFFVQKIKRSNLSLSDILEGMKKLVIVDTSLQRGQDDPQLIFESLNSTGLDLSQVDLIRNYMLMGLDSSMQYKIYREYWLKMERQFEQLEDTDLFDKFFRHYLTIKTGSIPKKGEIYQVFKKYYIEHRDTGVDQLVFDIYKYAKHFFKIVFQSESDKDIREVLFDLTELDMDVLYPFLLQAYEDYEAEKVNKQDFIKVLRTIESYVFRRSICEIPTNALNLIFANLRREVKEEKYLESVQVALLLKETYRAFPRDEMFKTSLMQKDVYNFRNVKYLFRKLENYKRKEKVNINEYTIEHIMPQNTVNQSEWQQELGQNWETTYEKFLHTIGNLTLTGYNSELSDHSFSKKKEIFVESPLQLTKGFANIEHWNEEAILKRAVTWADIAANEIWKLPKVDKATIERYKPKKELDQGAFTAEHHYNRMSEGTKQIYLELSDRIKSLDERIIEKYNKYYIALKFEDAYLNFVDVEGRKTKLKVFLNTDYRELDDRRNVADAFRMQNSVWTGSTYIEIKSMDEIDGAMELIEQFYDKQNN